MKLTVTQAAKRWKKSKGTIYARCDNGSLSFTIDDSNPKVKRKLIDVSELIRVFGPEEEQGKLNKEQKEPYPTEAVTSLLIERLNDAKSEIDFLKKQLEEQKDHYEARIRWLEKSLENKEEAGEIIRDIQTSVVKLLENKSEIQETLNTVEPQQEQPNIQREELKKKNVFRRVLEAALD